MYIVEYILLFVIFHSFNSSRRRVSNRVFLYFYLGNLFILRRRFLKERIIEREGQMRSILNEYSKIINADKLQRYQKKRKRLNICFKSILLVLDNFKILYTMYTRQCTH